MVPSGLLSQVSYIAQAHVARGGTPALVTAGAPPSMNKSKHHLRDMLTDQSDGDNSSVDVPLSR